jgi:hypothetical protein
MSKPAAEADAQQHAPVRFLRQDEIAHWALAQTDLPRAQTDTNTPLEGHAA